MTRNHIPDVGTMVRPDRIVRVLAKGAEQFVFIYTIDTRADALRAIARWASDPDIDFTWTDAKWVSALL